MYTQLELDKIYPGMWDITLQETSDIKHDYYHTYKLPIFRLVCPHQSFLRLHYTQVGCQKPCADKISPSPRKYCSPG